MATGETNFVVRGAKTYKRDRTPPAVGEQVLIIRADGDKVKVKKPDTTLPFVSFCVQVKGSGVDGAPDKWLFPALWLDCDGDRAGIYAGEGIVALAQALGEGEIPAKVLTSTHPDKKRQVNGPVRHLDAADVAAWLRSKDKREVKANLQHKKKRDVKIAKGLEDMEAFVDFWITDPSFAPSSPDDAPVEGEETPFDEGSQDTEDTSTSTETSSGASETTTEEAPEAEEPKPEPPKKAEKKSEPKKNGARKR